MKKNVFIIAALIIMVFGAGFYGGMIYGKNSSSEQDSLPNFQRFSGNLEGDGSGAVGRRNGLQETSGFISGEIISKDDSSMTVKLREGGSKIVFFSDTTQVMKTTNASSSNLAVGNQVTVTGSANSDGSISAQTIQSRSD